jgi:Hypervirulence associated proteins TUDOR domain
MGEKRFKKGDRVAWQTPQGETTGKVVEKLTSDARVGNEGQKGTKVSASEDDPRYVVESDKTGKRAAHKPDALERRGS